MLFMRHENEKPVIRFVPQIYTPLGPTSETMVCPNCHNTIKTTLKTEADIKTHSLALLLCCFLCLPCACIPYCIDSCQNLNHYCPNCDTLLGTYQHT